MTANYISKHINQRRAKKIINKIVIWLSTKPKSKYVLVPYYSYPNRYHTLFINPIKPQNEYNRYKVA